MGLPRSMTDLMLPQFYARRQVPCVEEINGDSQERIVQSVMGLNSLGTDPINLLIDSGGGSVVHGRWIADVIRHSVAPVHAIIIGEACSMAFWILQNCQRRICYPHARVMFHGYRVNNSPRVDQPNFQGHIDNVQRWFLEDLNFVIRRTRQPIEQWREWCQNEKFFEPQEALELNIIDEIRQPADFPIA